MRLLLSTVSGGAAGDGSDAWPMRQADIWNSGRADYVVSSERLDDSFFDIFLWQTRSPGNPTEGSLSSTSMVFFDAVGPAGTDVVVGGYHWPKGVQAMDRHTGELFWYGNPDGGEAIGRNTPAFSGDGSVIYVTNDATPHPLMAFQSDIGPSIYWHNGDDIDPTQIGAFSPTVAPDGRVFLHRWNDRPHGASDQGTHLTTTWSAETSLQECYSNPALYEGVDGLQVIATGRSGWINAYDGQAGLELWTVTTGLFTDADPTIDPDTGNIYLPMGDNDIYLAGLNAEGSPLWPTVAAQVYDYVPGENNPQRAQSAGCLSHDGNTFYFQTVSQEGDGRLYAIHTTDGSLKWQYDTQSSGWEMIASSPIVTRGGVVIVGNNEGDAYYAILDAGAEGQLLDTYSVAPDGNAFASATLSADGRLYLPLRTTQIVGAPGEAPSFQTENVFCAFDLTEGATIPLYPPAGQTAVAWNHAVALTWNRVPDPTGQFDHYAIYRSTSPFRSVAGMLPIGVASDINTTETVDNSAENDVSYYYGVTAVSVDGGEITDVESIGPRTPWDESDLQVVSIARSPEYPRYAAEYTGFEMEEPSGFGPYYFSASTGLGGGQTFADPRFPEMDDLVSYTATIRNRGTNPFDGVLAGTWRVDGTVVGTPSRTVAMAPGDTATFTTLLGWDAQPRELKFTLDTPDNRLDNNALVSDPLAVPFLTYVDRSFVEQFREVHTLDPATQNDDIIDWLNSHMARFNEMFNGAGTQKRVHYGVLEVIEDDAPDPPIDRSPYAIFPFRYHATDNNPRLSGYYHRDEDIDYGLLHEMGHQLGLIDIYQLDVPAEANQVSGISYVGTDGLMRNVSPFVSEFSTLAMEHWLHQAHGYYGQFLYNMPETIELRILGFDGAPLEGATVEAYQYSNRPGQGKVITDEIKFQGTTDANGLLVLPNVPIDVSIVPPIGTSDALHDNPFGYIDVVGTNGVLHFRVEYNGAIDYCWLDITEANVAYWNGQTEVAVFDRQLALGGMVQTEPLDDMTELNANDWSAWADGATASVGDDTVRKIVGNGALKFITDGGFDTYVRYPRTFAAQWDVTAAQVLNVSFYAENDNLSGFQSGSPWLILRDGEGDYFQYQYYQNGNPYNLLNDARDLWQSYQIPMDAADDTMTGWRRTASGTPDLSNIQSLEIHADTWDYGFTLWIDGVGFVEPIPGDFNSDGNVDGADLDIWQGGFGTTVGANLDNGEADDDGDVDGKDFLIWQRNYSGNLSSGAAADSSADPRATNAGGGAFFSTTDAAIGLSTGVPSDPPGPSLLRDNSSNSGQAPPAPPSVWLDLPQFQPLQQKASSQRRLLERDGAVDIVMSRLGSGQALLLGLSHQQVLAGQEFIRAKTLKVKFDEVLDVKNPRVDFNRHHEATAETAFLFLSTEHDDIARLAVRGAAKARHDDVLDDRANLKATVEELWATPWRKLKDILAF